MKKATINVTIEEKILHVYDEGSKQIKEFGMNTSKSSKFAMLLYQVS